MTFNIDIQNIEYIPRSRAEDRPPPISDEIARVPGQARLWHIPEIGRLEKRPAPVDGGVVAELRLAEDAKRAFTPEDLVKHYSELELAKVREEKKMAERKSGKFIVPSRV